MIEIRNGLFIGSRRDYEEAVRWEAGWRVVHACREPYHREALGYSGRAAPKHHPEYLIAPRGDRLILNLIDADDPAYVPREIIDAALAFIDESLAPGRRVLVHCNQGHSRAPAIGMLHLASRTESFSGLSYGEAYIHYREVYPLFDPAPGIRGYLARHWAAYCRGHGREVSREADE